MHSMDYPDTLVSAPRRWSISKWSAAGCCRRVCKGTCTISSFIRRILWRDRSQPDYCLTFWCLCGVHFRLKYSLRRDAQCTKCEVETAKLISCSFEAYLVFAFGIRLVGVYYCSCKPKALNDNQTTICEIVRTSIINLFVCRPRVSISTTYFLIENNSPEIYYQTEYRHLITLISSCIKLIFCNSWSSKYIDSLQFHVDPERNYHFMNSPFKLLSICLMKLVTSGFSIKLS